MPKAKDRSDTIIGPAKTGLLTCETLPGNQKTTYDNILRCIPLGYFLSSYLTFLEATLATPEWALPNKHVNLDREDGSREHGSSSYQRQP